jgi:DNA-3-methyladenine glycosylase I
MPAKPVLPSDSKLRCFWCTSDPLYISYHDKEWGVPVYEDDLFFEMLLLEGAQAGLSWLTILRRREGYRSAFANFDAEKIARFSQRNTQRLMLNPGIIRNRLKIEGAIKNARAFLKLQDEAGSFSDYLWDFVDGSPIRTPGKLSRATYRATSPESETLSKDLKKRGFTFVGSTIMYAFMQATGLVNDHEDSCFRYKPRHSK